MAMGQEITVSQVRDMINNIGVPETLKKLSKVPNLSKEDLASYLTERLPKTKGLSPPLSQNNVQRSSFRSRTHTNRALFFMLFRCTCILTGVYTVA